MTSTYTSPRHAPADLASTRSYINYVRVTHLHVVRNSRNHTLRVRIDRSATFSRATVEVLTPDLAWSTIVDLHPDLWAAEFVGPHQGAPEARVRSQAEELADALLLRGVEVLSGS